MTTLATGIGILSQGVKLCKILLSSNRYYAPGDRTIHFLMKGQMDESAVTVM